MSGEFNSLKKTTQISRFVVGGSEAENPII
jgi:hypothetical protein